MHLYLRLLRSSAHDYSDVEQQTLRELLEAGPGIERVKEISRHPKGGYRVTMDIVRESLDDLVLYIPSIGYMAAI